MSPNRNQGWQGSVPETFVSLRPKKLVLFCKSHKLEMNFNLKIPCAKLVEVLEKSPLILGCLYFRVSETDLRCVANQVPRSGVRCKGTKRVLELERPLCPFL